MKRFELSSRISNAFPIASAYLIVIAFISFLLLEGGICWAIGFRDPDTCWLLALGRWIEEHKSLPAIDPFSSNLSSYALVGAKGPLMQYQWLAEVTFYSTWRFLGNFGLLALTAITSCLACAAMPLTFFERGGVPRLLGLLLVAVGLYAASMRCVTRSELFSSLFLSILIAACLHWGRLSAGSRLKACAVSFVVVILWCNSHMLFPLAPIFLLVLASSHIAENIFLNRSLPPYSSTLVWLVVGAILASFVNPWGPGLWIYIQHLLVSPVSFANTETRPPDLSSPPAQELLFLTFTYVVYFAFCIKRFGLKVCGLVPLAYLLLAIVMVAKYAKLEQEGIIVAAAAASELAIRLKPKVEAPKSNVCAKISQLVTRIFVPLSRNWIVSVAVITLIGAILLCFSGAHKPSLPESTRTFTPPFEAIAFLNNHRPQGRMLNEALYGSVMTWYLAQPADLFIDGRFSMYEPYFVDEYERMLLCHDHWRELLGKYQINWIFVPAWMPISVALLHDAGWHQYYRDKDAVIIVKGK